MSSAVVAFRAVEDLAAFVHQVLCDKDVLDPQQTPLFRTPLKKGGRACGVVFHVEGPRLLRTSAVWSADADRIIFYDSTGTRFREVNLSESPLLSNAECGIETRRQNPPRGVTDRLS
ncbi:MAG: hypothetical protein JWO38_7283 [Gemmataceae bacterium]|nr:hypothetical protein [Gemmataceae bacterium]